MQAKKPQMEFKCAVSVCIPMSYMVDIIPIIMFFSTTSNDFARYKTGQCDKLKTSTTIQQLATTYREAPISKFHLRPKFNNTVGGKIEERGGVKGVF